MTRVLIRKDGSVVIEGFDYVGRQCLADLERLLKELSKLGVDARPVFQRLKEEAAVGEVVAVEG